MFMCQQAVRDLKWAIESPSLIEHPAVESISISPSRTVDDVDPDDLRSFLEHQTSHRVGYYFESLVHYWLLKIRDVHFVGKRLQIQDGKRTVGELDFLYRDEEGALTHMETAVKFFLHFPEDNSSRSHFIGPNAADNFERKMNRLFDHQLPVSQQLYPDIEKRVAYVKGRMFYHPTQNVPEVLPTPLAADHLRNTWLRCSEVDWFHQKHADCAFRILRKPLWLANERVGSDECSTLMSVAELTKSLASHFTESNHPNLVGILESRGSQFVEVARVFVVEDGWPGI